MFNTVTFGDVGVRRYLDVSKVIQNNKQINKKVKDLMKYEVQQGDTLTSIAFKHKISSRLLSNINHILNDIVIPGELLYVPIIEDDASQNSRS